MVTENTNRELRANPNAGFSRLWFGMQPPVLAIIYAFVLFGSLLASLFIRFDFEVPPHQWDRFWYSVVWIIPLKLVLLFIFGQFTALVSFFSLPDVKRIGLSMTWAAGVALVVWICLQGDILVPRSVILIDMVLSISALCALRTGLRLYRERFRENLTGQGSKRKRVAIIGAGSTGSALFREIMGKPGLGIDLVCFIDDDPSKMGRSLHGRPIDGPIKSLSKIAERADLDKVIIALPSAPAATIRSVIDAVNQAGLDHDILPSVTQMLHRQMTIGHLRHVEPEDLLNREPVYFDDIGLKDLISGKAVLVTGAGGSIGGELCRQIAARRPAKLILVERAEPLLFLIEQELLLNFPGLSVEPQAVDVTDSNRIHALFHKQRPHLVFHAAAHKHVPLMERQPAEAILNNACASEVIGSAAGCYEAEKCILVSTDKAVNPTSVMGATKRLAEKIFSNLQREYKCAYASVRFGNVLGSSGSVVPTFRRQIANGGPVTVTHPDVTRYFMSIPEAVALILQSSLLARGGEVFVLDMGEPVRIVDLAIQMIELSGLVPERDIEIKFTGLRPGEKLYEEPIHQAENIEPTSHPKLRRLRSSERSPDVLSALAKIRPQLSELSAQELRQWLKQLVPEYTIWEPTRESSLRN